MASTLFKTLTDEVESGIDRDDLRSGEVSAEDLINELDPYELTRLLCMVIERWREENE